MMHARPAVEGAQAERPSGIPVLGGMPWGTHFCQFYQTKEHLAEVLVPYFKAGLEGGEACVWVTSEALTADEARQVLSAAVPDLAEREARGQFEVFPYSEWYLADGCFDMARVLEGWRQKYLSALARGFEGLRVSGNTAWLEQADWESFSAYEQSIDGAIEGRRILVLCTYDLNRCSPYELLDVVRNHQFALIVGNRGWERIENAEARRAREEQRASEARYRQLFNAMNEGFAIHEVICDQTGRPVDYRFLDMNPAFERLTGLGRRATLGKTLHQVMPGAEPVWVERYGQVALTGEPAHFLQYAEALGRWYEVFAYCPAPGQFATIFMDVTETQLAQERLRSAADELARSNQELEQFASVASHDLQEPLRAVDGYLSLLETRCGDQLDEKSRHLVAEAVRGAGRMRTLIDDLLALSRLGTQGMQLRPANLNQVLAQALAALEASVREAGAVIDSDPLPTVDVDAGQIEQLFQNLIGNAIKFRGNRPPQVRITAQSGRGFWTLAVRDNGIGIDPQHFERIFQIFHRLHGRGHYPGTGIGLAICKKVVERHGGRIWVESQPGEGSTFLFTLPSRDAG
jgi:PAS domain S-box-containing protein